MDKTLFIVPYDKTGNRRASFKKGRALPQRGIRSSLRSVRLGESYIFPLGIATVVTLALYGREATLLLLKVGEVVNGVFDTSVPAFPLAGLLFVVFFVGMRWKDFRAALSDGRAEMRTRAVGLALVVLPLVPLLLFPGELLGSYAYAAVALATCWTGSAAATRPATLRFLLPYLLAYDVTIGSVSLLTAVAGDPLAVVVAALSGAMTWILGLPVHWSSVNIAFNAAGGSPVSLYISQECSGIASVSVFLLLIGLMHIDLRSDARTTVSIAVWGAALFIFLNALRVVVIIAGGLYGGVGLLWNLHGWVGYALYVGGYSLVLLAYSRSARRLTSPGAPA